MIIGLVGGVASDVADVAMVLAEDNAIQIVDAIEVLRLADRYTINSLTIQSYHKQYFLKVLENTFGTVIITGNIILSDDIIDWILENDGLIGIVSRKDMKSYDKDTLDMLKRYWDEPSTQKYHIEVRWKKLYERLKAKGKDVYYVDVSESDGLEELCEVSQEWEASLKTGVSSQEILEITSIRKDDESMAETLEESIKRCMKELGMEVTEDTPNQEQPAEPTKKTEKKKETKKEVKKTAKKDEKIPETFMNPPEDESEQQSDEQPEQENDEIESIFVKISDGTMALLLPAGLQMEKQIIAGMEFNVATVELPDLTSSKLQELAIKVGTQSKSQPAPKKPQEQPKTAIKRQPIIVEKPPIKTVVVSGDLKDLQEEKARLDAEIKKYRSLGNEEQVNALRKQRRAVRNKINALK